MTDRISVSCSNCGAGLKVDAEKAGKKIKCPKCNEVFVASSEDDFEEEAAEPQRKASPGSGRPGSKGKKTPAKKNGGGGGAALALIGGGVALLLIVGVIGLFASGALSSKPAAPTEAVAAAEPAAPASEKPAPAAAPKAKTAEVPASGLGFEWFPAETEVVVTLRMAELWQSPLISALRNDPMVGPQLEAAIAPVRDKLEIDFGQDVDVASIAIWGIDTAQNRPGFPGPFGGPAGAMPSAMPVEPGAGPAGTPQFAAFVQFSKPFPLSKIEELSKSNLNGDDPNATPPTSYTMNASGPIPTLKITRTDGVRMPFGDSLMYAQPSPTSILVGSGAAIEPLVARGKQAGHLQKFQELSQKFAKTGSTSVAQVGVLMIPKKLPEPSDQPPPLPPGAPPWMADLSQNMQREMKSFAFGLQVVGGIKLQTIVGTKSAEGSQSLSLSMSEAVDAARGQYGEQKAFFPPFAVELFDPLMASLKAEDAGSAVRISMELPASAEEQIAQLPAKIMGFMMTAGLNPNAQGGLGAFPGAMPGEGGLPGTIPQPPPSAIPANAVTVPAALASNLPEGATLSAKLYLKSVPPDRPNAPPVQLAVALAVQGLPTDADFLHLGKVVFKKITANGKQAMKANQTFVNVARPKDDQAIVPVSDFPPTPEGEVLVGEALILPPRFAVNVLSTVEGSFVVRTGKVLSEFALADASSAEADVEVTDDALKAAGVKIRRESGKQKNANGLLTETLTVTADKGTAIAGLTLVDDTGAPVSGATMSEAVQGGNPVWRVYIDKERKLPAGLTLKGKLIGEMHDQVVAFRFDDVSMPTQAQGGQAPTEGQPQPGSAANPN
jgi:predicted Zn finger-like uncharacterized protein